MLPLAVYSLVYRYEHPVLLSSNSCFFMSMHPRIQKLSCADFYANDSIRVFIEL